VLVYETNAVLSASIMPNKTRLGLPLITALACGLVSIGVRAEVIDSRPDGFLIKHSVMVPAKSKQVYDRFINPQLWWDSQHTWSGKAKNLSMRPKAGGCFCETLGNGGSVMHMNIIYVDPGNSIRLHGGLGPLQLDGVSGSMVVEFKTETHNPEQTIMTLFYSVGGYRKDGFVSLAPVVDGVLGSQINRLKESF
jgi:hypothetical protein